ncbi:hypothetical protein [Nitrosomonas eutropha]|nr:hypothetical protein [Nitrosomonas eutropha]
MVGNEGEFSPDTPSDTLLASWLAAPDGEPSSHPPDNPALSTFPMLLL